MSNVSSVRCSVESCWRIAATKGVCRRHRALVLTPSNRKTVEQFWASFARVGECLEWNGHIGTHGYGVVRMDGRQWLTHRLAYTLATGPIASDLQIDHLCRNTKCGAPSHLEAVTARVNTLRSTALSAQRAQQTECQHGHPFTPENTYSRPDRLEARMCRTCMRRREQAKVQRKRA